MRHLPWHVSVRADRKALMTALGISLGVSFSVVGFTLAGALHGESISEEGRFGHPDALLSRADGAPFDVRAMGTPDLVVVIVRATTVDGVEITLAGVEGERAPPVPPSVAWPGPGAPVVGQEILVRAPSSVTLPVGRVMVEEAPEIDATWVVVAASTARAIGGLPDGSASYALYDATDAPSAPEGFEAASVPGVEPFFRASGVEIARNLLLVVAFSTILVALFAYEFLRTEIRERRREIGLWRSIGLRVNDVAVLLLCRGAFIASLGSLLGFLLALAALGAAARATGSGVFEGALSWGSAAGLFAVFVAGGTLGAAVPALRGARTPVREWLEAGE